MSEDSPARGEGHNPKQETTTSAEHVDAAAAASVIARRPIIDPAHVRESTHGMPESSDVADLHTLQERIESDLDPQRAEAVRGAMGILDHTEQGKPEDVDQIVQFLKAAGLGEEQATILLETDYAHLDQETKNAIMEGMSGTTLDPKEKMTPEESESRFGPVHDMAQNALLAEEGKLAQMEQEIAQAATPAEKKKKQEKHDNHHGMVAKLKHFVDVPPKEWGVRFGKTLAGILALIVLTIILEMAMINKAVGKR